MSLSTSRGTVNSNQSRRGASAATLCRSWAAVAASPVGRRWPCWPPLTVVAAADRGGCRLPRAFRPPRNRPTGQWSVGQSASLGAASVPASARVAPLVRFRGLACGHCGHPLRVAPEIGILSTTRILGPHAMRSCRHLLAAEHRLGAAEQKRSEIRYGSSSRSCAQVEQYPYG